METLSNYFFHPISIILYAYIGLWLWETAFPAKELPKMKYWKIKGVLFFVFNFTLASVFPLLVDNHLAAYQLVDFSGANPMLAAFTGIFIYQGLLYAWHWGMHNSNILWRVFHQMHHSTERLDIPSAFYTSPMDTIGFTMIGSLSFVLIIGLSAEAATIALLSLTFLSLFQHANIKTPQWIGYFIQRPESHNLHHARGIHKYNYSDFPIFDMLFGTFRNPKEPVKETGFYNGGSTRILEMLSFQDVSKPKTRDQVELSTNQPILSESDITENLYKRA